MRPRGKAFLAGDVVQFRLKKGGSWNLFARWPRWHRDHQVGSPTRSAFLQEPVSYRTDKGHRCL
jgi:hypothetical protein